MDDPAFSGKQDQESEKTMAATTDISINNQSAVAKTFTPSIAVANGYDYRETSSPISAPSTLRVTHVLPAASSSANTKAGVRFTKVALNSASQIRTGYIDVTISVPKDGVTAADVSDMGAYVRNFLSDANITKLLLGGF